VCCIVELNRVILCFGSALRIDYLLMPMGTVDRQGSVNLEQQQGSRWEDCVIFVLFANVRFQAGKAEIDLTARSQFTYGPSAIPCAKSRIEAGNDSQKPK
jgi:hypothetical protein